MSTPQTDLTPEESPEPALSATEMAAAAPEIFAQTVGEYLSAWWRRIKNGESGAMPVLLGMVGMLIFFQIERSAFLSAGDIVNMLVEAALYVIIGAGETFILLLSEIDLSLGYGVGIGGFVITELIAAPINLPWWLGILGAIAALGMLGLLQGLLVTRLGLPSFIVTLGGQLGFLGLMEELASVDKTAVGGVMQLSPSSPIAKLATTDMSPTLTWAVVLVSITLFAAFTLNQNRSRRARGLHTTPVGVSLLTVGMVAVVGVVLALITNTNQSALGVIKGMPWVIPYVMLIVLGYTWLLGRTRTGRYIYAVGNNKEAARRAGINVNWIVTFAFIMSSVTAALASVVYISEQGSMATDIDGGQLVLFAVAAAVIGGTTLFGGRGRMVNALLGGVVIAVVFNGLAIMGVGAAVQDIATAVVLLAAVSLDAVVRRRSIAH
ncbi:MAG: ABC transporter permease subunit [Solirubrobacteraceae bacterium]